MKLIIILEFQSLSEEDIIICLYLVAIDLNDLKSINELNIYCLKQYININMIRNDILYEIYKRKLLDKYRLKRIISMIFEDGIQLKITPELLILLIENNDIEALKLIFENNYYNNNFIKSMLYNYKFKNKISDKNLKNIINNEINNFCLNKLNKEQKCRALALAAKNKYEKLMKILILSDITVENGKKYYSFLYAFKFNTTEYVDINDIINDNIFNDDIDNI
ncbi:hypothetical protein PIROE2DRAFT_16617, partial [Piromyces sp. E2]